MSAERVRVIELLRRLRMTAVEIAEVLRMPLSTVSAVLQRIGLGKRSRLEPFEPANRYECARPGELVHVDVKKLARFTRPGHRLLGRGPGRFAEGAGYEYVHVCVDDFSRLAYVEVLSDERAVTAIGFLRRALAWFAAQGVRVERVMTDNGPYISHAHRLACRALGIRHSRTKPRRPRTNGKAERFIQTMLGGWAYARLYASSAERTRVLPVWSKPLQLPQTTRQPRQTASQLKTEQRLKELQLVLLRAGAKIPRPDGASRGPSTDIQGTMQPAAHPADTPAGSWRVSREGAPVATVGLRHERGQVVVAAVVTGVATARPYQFGTIEAADAFVGDLITSFVYLGCDIARD